ncbi:hypothetical protein [Pantoea sp. SoEX]|uniref:hypothetical protein n=1 Tax=Pantoea sp. SoEX TaxID=2576763 RepID=UPI001356C420|nr:hypothetical protein [Pantoea sp. SoEX]
MITTGKKVPIIIDVDIGTPNQAEALELGADSIITVNIAVATTKKILLTKVFKLAVQLRIHQKTVSNYR